VWERKFLRNRQHMEVLLWRTFQEKAKRGRRRRRRLLRVDVHFDCEQEFPWFDDFGEKQSS